jgi:tRNA A-37 threonylcarbamoyl transferase component Bud32
MIDSYGYVLADEEFYAPPSEVAVTGGEFRPTTVPPRWTASSHTVWSVWNAPGVARGDAGWKVHVSAQLERAQGVLDVVARACFSERVSFKHIRTRFFFLALHHKHGPRSQSGKFCALYPADEAIARRLMDRLAQELADEDGPYVLTDRRYRDSRVVHYRWGAFTARRRRRPDGGQDWLVRDGFGRDVLDKRGPSFALPAGIEDPFVSEEAAAHGGAIVLDGAYEILRPLQPSNAGGTYEGRDVRSGRRMFVKEARAHDGLAWDASSAQARLRREYEVLLALHAIAPGICPEPIDLFREWEHDFLVTEFVAGTRLDRWTATRSPVIQALRTHEEFAAYYAACERILAELDLTLARIRGSGFRFGDLSLSNVIVDDDGRIRLVDFETASPLDVPAIRMGTDGYTPPPELIDTTACAQDEWGARAVALALLFPLHQVLQRRPGNLALLRRDLEEHAPVPQSLWQRARRYGEGALATDEWPLPAPGELDARPREWLEWLQREVERGVLAMFDASDDGPPFPTVPRGFETTRCVSHMAPPASCTRCAGRAHRWMTSWSSGFAAKRCRAMQSWRQACT